MNDRLIYQVVPGPWYRYQGPPGQALAMCEELARKGRTKVILAVGRVSDQEVAILAEFGQQQCFAGEGAS